MTHKIPGTNLELSDEEIKFIKNVFRREIDFDSVQLTDEELLDMNGEHYYKSNPPLEPPVFFTGKKELRANDDFSTHP